MKVGTLMVTLAGERLGMDETARHIGEDFGWDEQEMKKDETM